MKVRIIVKDNGEVGLFTDQGTFVEGAEILNKLMAQISSNLVVKSQAEPEQHRHDDQGNHVHTQIEGKVS